MMCVHAYIGNRFVNYNKITNSMHFIDHISLIKENECNFKELRKERKSDKDKRDIKYGK